MIRVIIANNPARIIRDRLPTNSLCFPEYVVPWNLGPADLRWIGFYDTEEKVPDFERFDPQFWQCAEGGSCVFNIVTDPKMERCLKCGLPGSRPEEAK